MSSLFKPKSLIVHKGKRTQNFSVVQNEEKFYQDIKFQVMMKRNGLVHIVSHDFQVSFFESVAYNHSVWYV